MNKKPPKFKETSPPGLHFWLCFELMLQSLWGLLARSLGWSWHLLLRDPQLALGWGPCWLGWMVLGLLLLLLVPRQAEEEAQDGL